MPIVHVQVVKVLQSFIASMFNSDIRMTTEISVGIGEQ